MVSWRDRQRTHVPKEWFSRHHRFHLRPGDICLTAAAHRPKYIGLKVDLLDEVPDVGAMPSGEVMVIRLRDHAPFRPEQLLFYLRSPDGYAQIQDAVRGSTAHLYPQDVEKLMIPPLEQQRDADRVCELFAQSAAAFRSYLQLETEATMIAASAIG